MKYFYSGFLLTSGCLTAILFIWLVTQVFVRLKSQEITSRGQPRVLHVHLPTQRGSRSRYLSSVFRMY